MPANLKTIRVDNLTHIVPPVEFHCTVNGNPLKAKLIGIEDNPIRHIYKVSFSDGYTSLFNSTDYGWEDQHQKLYRYVNAIKTDLNSFSGFFLEREIYCFRISHNNQDFNVWVRQYLDNDNLYTVYFKGDYHFTLRRSTTGRWEAYCLRKIEPEIVDMKLAAKICDRIDNYPN